MKRQLILFFLSVCIGGSALADAGCVAPVTELQAGVFETDLGNVRIKLEQYNKIAKMKLISSLNEDWTSVSTETEIGEITGYYGNGSDAKLVSQFIVKQQEEGFEWAILKIDSSSNQKGMGYFYFDGKLSCIPTSLDAWRAAVTKAIGEPGVTSAVNVSNDSL